MLHTMLNMNDNDLEMCLYLQVFWMLFSYFMILNNLSV